MRRFVEPSEGDSIFNYDRDMKKKWKMRASLGPHVRSNILLSQAEADL